MKILLIEDDAQIREPLVELLELEDYQVQAVENGKQAFKVLETFLPDLIITDILMPEMDGYEVLLNMRDMPQIKNVPVLVASAMAAPYQITTAKTFGAQGYLTKPFSSSELLLEIERIMGPNKENKEG